MDVKRKQKEDKIKSDKRDRKRPEELEKSGCQGDENVQQRDGKWKIETCQETKMKSLCVCCENPPKLIENNIIGKLKTENGKCVCTVKKCRHKRVNYKLSSSGLRRPLI